MTIGFASHIFQTGVLEVLILAGPVLIVSIGVGLIVSILQATTSIQEQTLSFVPKIAAILLALFLFGPWMFTTLTQYAHNLFSQIPNMVQ